MDKHFSLHGRGSTLELNVDGERVFALIKNYQIDTLKDSLIHVDFQELSAGEKVKVKLPIRFFNKDLVEDGSTVVAEQIHEVELIALPKDLFESIEIDVASLKDGGDAICLCDLEVFKDERFEFLMDSSTILATTTKAGSAEETVVEEEPNLLASL
jgi:large subunit ribosomal protein L25